MSSNKLFHFMPPHVIMLQALHHRIPRSHQRFPQIERNLHNERSGYYGETKLLYPLSKFSSFHKTLPNVRLLLNGYYFQMDFLVITPKFLLILESKYYSDDLLFDETVHQVIQKKDQEYKVFDDPVLQVEEQAYQLSLWLDLHNFSDLPIESFVVMTNSRTRLQIDPLNTHHADKVVSLQRIPSLLRELLSKYNRDRLTSKDVTFLANNIQKQQQGYLPNILKKYRVSNQDILRGIFCMKCGTLGMKMIHQRWQCMKCGFRDSAAHEQAVKDYYLLFGKNISNLEFRNFVELESRYTARDMLKRVSSHMKGEKRSTTYHLSFDYRLDFNYLDVLSKIRMD